MKRLDSIKLKPVKETNEKVAAMGFKPLTDAVTAKEFLRRPEVTYQEVVEFIGSAADDMEDKIIDLCNTEITYEGYISKAEYSYLLASLLDWIARCSYRFLLKIWKKSEIDNPKFVEVIPLTMTLYYR